MTASTDERTRYFVVTRSEAGEVVVYGVPNYTGAIDRFDTETSMSTDLDAELAGRGYGVLHGDWQECPDGDWLAVFERQAADR